MKKKSAILEKKLSITKSN